MSQWVKMLAPQRGIEPCSLTIQASFITANQDTITFTPPRRKYVLTLFEHISSQESHVGYQMSQWVKMLVPQWGIKAQSLSIQASIRTCRQPGHNYI